MMFSRGRHLALVVNEQRITAVEVTANGAKTALRSVAVSFNAEINLNDPQRLGRELKAALRRGGLGASRCVVGLAASWIVCREKLLPPADEQSLRGIVSLAVERDFASDNAELAFDYSARSVPGGGQSVLIAAAAREIVDQVQALAAAAGLEVLAVTSSSVALARSCGPAGPGGRIVLCVLATGIEAVVISGQSLRLVRHLPVRLQDAASGATLDGHLRRLLPLLGASGTEPPELLVWDCAGVGHAPLSAAAEALHLPVRFCTLASDLGLSGPDIPSDAALAAPAALARAGEGPEIDFLHSRLSEPARARVGPRALLGGVVAAALLAIGIFLFVDWRSEQHAVTTMVKELADSKPARDEAKIFNADIRSARQWFDTRAGCLGPMREVTRAFPSEGRIWATSLEIREDRQVTVTGKSLTEAAVLDVLDRLKANRKLSNIETLYVRNSGSASPAVTFSFKLNAAGVD
ncbi:MAG: hypothetical protein ABFD92_05930 [Planctomycetaceae bacterium]|nr:hypothetical protein [Planctomycetaceae bacterium]